MTDPPKTPPLYSTGGVSTIVSSSATATVLFGGEFLRYNPTQIQKPAEDHKIYSLVGRVCSEWAHLEHILDETIWDLAEINPERGACITAQLIGHRPRRLTIIALTAHLKLERNTGKVEAFMNKLSNLAEDRNRIVHDPWYQYTGTDKTGQFRSMDRRELEFGIKEIDLTMIEATISAIQTMAQDYTQLKSQIFAELKALRERPR